MNDPNPSAIAPLAKRSRRSDLREKKTYGYRERDEGKRQHLLNQLAEIDPSQVVYLYPTFCTSNWHKRINPTSIEQVVLSASRTEKLENPLALVG
jgi:hypothetical protein